VLRGGGQPGEPETCIEDETGLAVPVNKEQATKALMEYSDVIELLRDYEAGRITMTLDQYQLMPAVARDAMRIWRSSKVQE
jgi:4-hydroxy-L-threonine phosphate dehydrogenase PdxA